MSDHYARVFMNSVDPILIEDLGGIVVDMNRQAELSYGWSRKELLGKPIKTIVPPERHSQADELLSKCKSGLEVRNVEGLRMTKDGDIVPVLLTLSLLKDDSEKAFSIATIAKDISAQKKAEDGLKRMSKVFMDATDPILVEDLDGIVVNMNRQSELSYGWSRKELLGKPIKTIVPPERHSQADELLSKCKSGLEVRNVEGLRVTKDGDIVPVLLTLSLLKDDSEKAFSIATIAKDISAQKKAEEELKNYQNHLQEIVEKRTLELEQKKDQLIELSSELSKYLSPQIYESIFSGKRQATIESHRKKLTIFFSDIVSFTQTTERMEPEDITSLLNIYLGKMAQIAIKYGGTIDKYIGDAVMIFFGDPASNGSKSDALACVSMAIEMIHELKRMQEQWYLDGIISPFKIRIGINTGYCTVGNFGSPEKMDYTIIGSQVNAASRLESTAQPDQILISHETWSLVRDEVACVKNNPIIVKGIPHPIQVYQVLDFHDQIDKSDREQAIGALLEPAKTISHDTHVSDLHLGRRAEDSFYGFIVVKEDEPVGLVMNYHLMQILTSHSYRETFFKQPVSMIMDSSPLMVGYGELISVVIEKVLKRESAKKHDHIIVLDEKRLAGVVPVLRLLEIVSSQNDPSG